MEFLVVLLVAALLVRLIKYFFAFPRSEAPLILTGNAQVYRSGSRNASSQWVEAGQSFICRGYSVEDGMVYAGERMRDFTGANEGCLIDPSLPVAPPGTPYEPVKDIRPRYETLTSAQRGGYLHWLGEGRCGRADVSWVFLFFYGIERRFFVDGPRGYVSHQERDELVSEVFRLMKQYGDIRSFRGYCNNLLAVEWVLKGEYAEIPDWVDFTDRFCAETFNAIFALYVSRNKPIPGEVALQWFVLHPESAAGTASRRSPEVFQKLFLEAYKEKFGDGIIIHNNRTPLHIIYKGANPSLANGVKLSFPSLPDPFLLITPLKKICALAEECVSKMEEEGMLEMKGGVFEEEYANPLDSLDDVHCEFIARLASKMLWTRGDVLSICEELSIFPEPSFELLNAWSCVAGGLPLIEDGDPVFVDIPLLQEILMRKSSDADTSLSESVCSKTENTLHVADVPPVLLEETDEVLSS